MNEVKRALVFWPAFTSALIVLLSLIAPLQDDSWKTMADRMKVKWQLTAIDESDSVSDIEAVELLPEVPAAVPESTFAITPPANVGSNVEPELTLAMPEEPVASVDVDLDYESPVSIPPLKTEVPATLHASIALPESSLADPSIADREESGSRAMAMPERIAIINGPSPKPHVEPQDSQWAALILQPPKEESDDIVKVDDLDADQLGDQKPAMDLAQQLPVDIDTTETPEVSLPSVPQNASTAVPKSAEPEQLVSKPLVIPTTEETIVTGPLFTESLSIETVPVKSTAAKPAAEPLVVEQKVEQADPIVAPRDETIVMVLPAIEQPRMPESESVAETVPPTPTEQPSILPRSVSLLAKVVPKTESTATSTIATTPADQPQIPDGETSRDSQTAKRTTPIQSVAWPLTPRLNKQLELLISSDPQANHKNEFASAKPKSIAAADWAQKVQANLQSLRSLPRLSDQRAHGYLTSLRDLISIGYDSAERASSRQQQVQWLTAVHSVSRRVAIWEPVYNIVHTAQSYVTDEGREIADASQIQQLVDKVQSDLAVTGDAEGWSNYLLLTRIVQESQDANVEDRSLLAQRFLSRTQWHGLDATHRNWMNRPSINALKAALQPWAQAPIDYIALLNDIESQEADSIDMAAIDIAGAAQTLRFSSNPAAKNLARAIDMHYRNANIRTAFSEELLRRMLPEVAPQRLPVRTQMLGSRVRGVSEVNSELDIRLFPSNNKWTLALDTTGNIETQSIGRRERTSISTRGRSNFAAETPITITPDGIALGDSQIDVQGRTRLRGIKTGYDNWPLIGSLVQSIAESRYRDVSQKTSRLANRRMQSQIGTQLDDQLNQKVDKLSSLMNNIVLGPFSHLQLSPKVVDMQSTEERLVARYRLAGDWQIGAFTPRPRAPVGNLVSLQINQSAINNTLERVVPDDEPTTIHATFNETMRLFGQENVRLPDDIPSDVRIQFAKTRPITVEIEEGLIWLTMRVVELSREKGPKLRRFIVRASYRPQIQGLEATLVRDGHLRISGPGMSMRQRLPIRAIFNKVLSPNHNIPLTTPDLIGSTALADAEISQLELRDGWLAIAISDRRRVARSQPFTPTR